MAILLVVAVSLADASLRGASARLGWAGFAAAALFPLGIAFVGFLVLWAWVLTVSITLLVRRV
jgi:hypothetical protein